MVLQISQLRTLYKTMFIPEMTFYRKPDKGRLVNQKQPSSSYVLRSLNVNYILVKHNIKNLIWTVDDALFHGKLSALTSHVKGTLSAQRSPTIPQSGVTCCVTHPGRYFPSYWHLCPLCDVTLIELQSWIYVLCIRHFNKTNMIEVSCTNIM